MREKAPDIAPLTKKYASEQRQATAKAVHEAREMHAARQRELAVPTEQALNQLEQELSELSEIRKRSEALASELSELKQGILRRWLNRTAIEVKQSSFEDLAQRAEAFEQRATDARDRLATLQKLREDRTALQQAAAVLDAFYREQSVKLPAYRDSDRLEEEAAQRVRELNKEASSVASVMRQHGVFFVHAIHPTFVPDHNSIIDNNTDWRTKLRVAVGFQPTLSSSVIHEGDNDKSFWAHAGVLLRDGTITRAMPRDAGTRATGIRERTTGYFPDGELYTQVLRSIRPIPYGGRNYNEFVVEQPEIVGIFVFPPDSSQETSLAIPPHADVASEARQLGLPVYLYTEGKFHAASYDSERQEYIKSGAALTPDDVSQAAPISEELGTRTREELFDNSPFEFTALTGRGYEEFCTLFSHTEGRQMFIGLYLGRNKLPEGTPTERNNERKVFSFISPGGTTDILTDAGTTYWVRRRKGKTVGSGTLRPDSHKGNCIWIGPNSWFFRSGSVFGIRDYVTAMQREFVLLSEERDTAPDEETRTFKSNIIRRLAGHCHGFAQQAAELGDIAAANAALAVANSMLPVSELESLRARRLGPNGEMRITPEDLSLTSPPLRAASERRAA